MAGKGNSVQSYQAATNQLLQINAQRKGNLAEAKNEETLAAARNATLAQTSEFVSSQSAASAPVNATLNPATRNILGQYGLGQPKVQKSSSSSQQVTKQNVVINNKNTTVTNNNVHVPANIGGPVQGRPIQFQDANQIKFKNWVSNSLAQQNEITAKKSREYAKRDSALSREANKLMRKLDEAGKNIAANLNPKNMANTMGNQFKTLLMVLGIGYLAKKWPEVLDKIDEIEDKIVEFKNGVIGFFSKGGGFVQALGGKEGESVFQAFKNLFVDEKDGLFAYIKLWLGNRMSERGTAIKNLVKPDTKWVRGEGLEKNIIRILGNVVGYLGDIFTAIIDPTKAAGITMNRTAQEQSQEYQENNADQLFKKSNQDARFWDPNANGGKGAKMGVSVSNGDVAIVTGQYQGLSRGAVDNRGNLTNTPIAAISQASEVERAIKESRETGNLQTATVATGFSRLMNSAKSNGTVPLTEDFIKRYLSDDEIRELGLKPTPYTYILRKKTDEELAMDLLSLSKNNTKLAETLTGIGMLGGTLLGGAPGMLIGGLTGETIAAIKNLVEKNNIPKYTYELRKGNANYQEVIRDPNSEYLLENDDPRYKAPKIYEVTPEVLQKIINKMSGTDLNIDINSADYVKNVEKAISSKTQPNHSDINVDQLYAPNMVADEHRQQEHEFAANLRARQGAGYIKDQAVGLYNRASERVSDMTSSVGGMFSGGGGNNNRGGNGGGNGAGAVNRGNGMFSHLPSARYNLGNGRGEMDWSDIRMNKKDDKYAHAGTGSIGRDRINREYLTNLLNREISGEFGRKEGQPDQCYVNPLDGGAQAGHGNYGYGNTYNTLKNLYNGPVNFKMPDGSVHKESNLISADKWFVNYWKTNAPGNKMPASKKVKLTKESADAINKASFSSFIDGAIKMDPDIMGAMDEQTLGGLLHIAYGGMARYNKLISFYKNHKDEALSDLQANNGVHSEDFINRVMMNTPEGLYAMQTDNTNGTHFDRRGYLSGYQTFNVYKAGEWEEHLALGNNNRSTPRPVQPTPPPQQPVQNPNDYNNLANSTTLPEVNIVASPINNNTATNQGGNSAGSDTFPGYASLPEVDIVASPINNNANSSQGGESDTFPGYASLPEVDIVASPVTPTSSTPTTPSSYTPASNFSDNYSSAFSGSNGGGSEFSNIQNNTTTPNYLKPLDVINSNLEFLGGLVTAGNNATIQGVQATNNVVAAVSSLRSQTSPVPSSANLTELHEGSRNLVS